MRRFEYCFIRDLSYGDFFRFRGGQKRYVYGGIRPNSYSCYYWATTKYKKQYECNPNAVVVPLFK